MGWRIETTVRIAGMQKRDLLVTIPPVLHEVLNHLASRGQKGLVVGGAVRDGLRGQNPHDLDVEVYGSDVDTLADTLRQHGKVSLVGKQFGVVKLRDREGRDYDFSVPRRDSKTGVGHRDFRADFDPSITPKEAAARRDFTVNSMGWDPLTHELHDYHGGEQDLKDRVLRHTSGAFSEDPLRVLRGMGFASRYGMMVHPDTAKLSQSIAHEYHTIPKERIAQEFMKVAAAPEPGRAIDYLKQTGWHRNFPELHAIYGVKQEPSWHPEGDLEVHTAHSMDAAAKIADREGLQGEDRAALVFGAMTHDFGKPSTTRTDGQGRIISHGHDMAGGPVARSFLDSIGIKQSISDHVEPLVREHMQHLNFQDGISSRTVRRLAERLQPSSIKELSMVMEADHSGRPPLPGGMPEGAQKMLDKAGESHVVEKPMQPLVQGRHVLPYFNNEPGPHIGEVLKDAHEAQLNGEINTHEEGQEWLKKRFSNTVKESHRFHYHVAPTEVRESIEEHGLDSSKGVSPWPGGMVTKPGNYLYKTEDEAQNYIESDLDDPDEERFPLDQDWDIYKVDTKPYDVHPDPEDYEPYGDPPPEEGHPNDHPGWRHVIYQPIKPEHVERVDSTYIEKKSPRQSRFDPGLSDEEVGNLRDVRKEVYKEKDPQKLPWEAQLTCDETSHKVEVATKWPQEFGEYWGDEVRPVSNLPNVGAHWDKEKASGVSHMEGYGHYWNRKPDGTIVDASSDQFKKGEGVRVIPPDDPRQKDYWTDTSNTKFSDACTECDDQYKGSGDLHFHYVPWGPGHPYYDHFSKLAMPRDDEFLEGLRYEHEHPMVDDKGFKFNTSYVAAYSGDRRVGHLQWVTDAKKVGMLWVEPAYQRHGLATELWNRAKVIEPDLQHSDDQTADGSQWAKSVEGSWRDARNWQGAVFSHAQDSAPYHDLPRLARPDPDVPHLALAGEVYQKEGSWQDVRNKAVRLRNANLVTITRLDDDVITAEVQGDHQVYEVVLYRQYPGSFAITTWTCSCEWGGWAWKRVRFFGRLCSHALATLYEAHGREYRKTGHVWDENDSWEHEHPHDELFHVAPSAARRDIRQRGLKGIPRHQNDVYDEDVWAWDSLDAAHHWGTGKETDDDDYDVWRINTSKRYRDQTPDPVWLEDDEGKANPSAHILNGPVHPRDLKLVYKSEDRHKTSHDDSTTGPEINEPEELKDPTFHHQKMWHVSPSSNRESIEEGGLRGGSFAFSDIDEARWYHENWSGQRTLDNGVKFHTPHDLWEIDSREVHQSPDDVWPEVEEGKFNDAAHILSDEVPPGKLKRIARAGSFGDEFLKFAGELEKQASNSRLTIYPQAWRPVILSVEMATGAGSIQQGLMFRPMLPMMSGMVFIPNYIPSYTGFWMKNVRIPLSIAFWDRAGRITQIIDMDVCPANGPCPTYKPSQPFWGAVEVNRGFFKTWGIRPGDRIELLR